MKAVLYMIVADKNLIYIVELYRVNSENSRNKFFFLLFEDVFPFAKIS